MTKQTVLHEQDVARYAVQLVGNDEESSGASLGWLERGHLMPGNENMATQTQPKLMVRADVQRLHKIFHQGHKRGHAKTFVLVPLEG